MNQNRTVFDIDEETDAFYLQKAVEYHEWLIQQEAQPRLTRTPIFRDREDAERRLRADYFDDPLCIVNMEQVKEIGKIIGVSWVRTEEEEDKVIESSREGNKACGSPVWEKRWIRYIIKDERLDVIGLQETKCGVVDDIWVEDIWGRRGGGYGYSQLPAKGNSGGKIPIWDARVFMCNEAIRDERFIAVKREWKGNNEDVFLVCIYGRIRGRNEDIFNSLVNIKEITEFNDFINNTRLVGIPIGGRKFTRSKPNEKLLVNSIKNGPYVRRMIHEPSDPNGVPLVDESTHKQTDDELTKKEVKQMKADDQDIQTILMGLPEDIYAVEKTAKFFNEWEMFTSTEGESIELYYHYFSNLMNDYSRNKHFLEMIASNLKFLNNLQPKWQRSVTTVHQTKDRHVVDYIQLYDFLKFNQAEVDAIRAERLARTHDPLTLMANSQNPYNYPVFHQDQPSPLTYMKQSQPNNNYIPQHELHATTNAKPRIHFRSHNCNEHADCTAGTNCRESEWNGLIVVLGIANPNRNENGVAAQVEGNGNGNNVNQIRCYNYIGLGHYARNCTVKPRRRDAAYFETQLLIAQKEEARI
ncbi:integrase, catalytic region, zinc finger, CCHC-type containing protein [Tanacetum coccineum]